VVVAPIAEDEKCLCSKEKTVWNVEFGVDDFPIQLDVDVDVAR